MVLMHGSLQQPQDSFSDAAFLMKAKPKAKKLILGGDLNIDVLPAMERDPFASDPDREYRHHDARLASYAFEEAFSMNSHVPETSVGVLPPSLTGLDVPCSRIPDDSQAC